MPTRATPLLPLWNFPLLVGIGVICVVISAFIIYPILFYMFLGGIVVACQFAFNRHGDGKMLAAAIYRTIISLFICACVSAEALWIGIMIVTHVTTLMLLVIAIISCFIIGLAVWGFSRLYAKTSSGKQWIASYLAALALALASFALWFGPFLGSFIECHTIACYQTFSVTAFTGVLWAGSGLGGYFLSLFLLLASSLLRLPGRRIATSMWFLSYVGACFWYGIRILAVVWALSLLAFSLLAAYTLPYIALALIVYLIASIGQWLCLRGGAYSPYDK